MLVFEVIKLVSLKGGLLLEIKQNTHLYILHGHKVLMK